MFCRGMACACVPPRRAARHCRLSSRPSYASKQLEKMKGEEGKAIKKVEEANKRVFDIFSARKPQILDR